MRPSTWGRLLGVWLVLTVPAAARASDVDDLITALSGPDEQARTLARQLLPREGVAIVARLLPLLSSDQTPVREAAFQVLADVANEASAPGRETDRKAVTAQLMTLLKPEQSPDIKIRGLRLLPVACPNDGDVAPIAALLGGDVRLRERAREALEEIGSGPSRQALREYLGKAGPDFDCALLNSLGRLHDREGVEKIASLLETAPLKVQLAAARALAWTGDPSFLGALQKLAVEAPAADRAEANDALLRLLNATARRPGGRQAALDGYVQLLRSATGQVRDGALAGLARIGDPASWPSLLEAIKDEALRAEVKEIRSRAVQPETTSLLARVQRGLRVDANLLGQLGVIGRWWVVGPFDLGERDEGWQTRYIGEPDVNVVARYMAGKVRRQWKRVDSHESQGRIDLRAAIADRDHCVGYALAEVELDKPTDAILLLGVDDSERVWVNGQKVFELFTRRGLQVDQDRIPVKLKAGTNTILLKVFQDTLGWEFCARIVTPDGQPLPFTQKAD
jgi:HEAT repeat protein